MQKERFEDIVREDSKIQIERLQGQRIIRSLNGNVGHQPLIEGSNNHRSLPGFLEEDPRYSIGNGTFKRVPLLTGVNKDETANGIEIKKIERIFRSATTFLDSVANSSKKNGLLGNVLGANILPGVGKNYIH